MKGYTQQSSLSPTELRVLERLQFFGEMTAAALDVDLYRWEPRRSARKAPSCELPVAALLKRLETVGLIQQRKDVNLQLYSLTETGYYALAE